MKISLITVCYNAEKTIERTIQSVIRQNCTNYEYIIIDGLSTDKTMQIINKYSDNINLIISENDNGIYDAINKGILNAKGDIIGILNADDEFFSNDILSAILKKFDNNYNLDSIIGNIIFSKNNKIHRFYSSLNWTPTKFQFGLMPPHPSFYCKKNLFNKFGLYRTDFKIAADYELLIRFLFVNKISFEYLPKIFVKMNLGGISTKNIFSRITINKEVLYACRLNNLKTNYLKLYIKYLFKIFEYRF